jgi:RNA-directed DNA polymerase
MTNQPISYEDAQRRLREVGRERFIREDMIRLGFWTEEDVKGTADPPEEVARVAEIKTEIKRMRGLSSSMQDEKALLQAIVRKRMEESRRKQAENKARRERERAAKAQEWEERKARDVIYLGPGVSGGLRYDAGDAARAQAVGVPWLDTPAALAAALGVSVGALRQLTFARPIATSSQYVRFTIPKKTGGVRVISAPLPRLKAAQHWVLEHILNLIPTHEAAHGFMSGRSIVSNAQPHVGAKVVINMDLKDFFPSVHWKRVKGLFSKMGYPEAVSTILSLLCTEPEREEVELDGQRYYVSQGARWLPQGAPTSPALTNLLCRKLDRRLSGLAKALGFTYTRYADDLTFSGTSDEANAHVGWLLKSVHAVVDAEGFVVHPQKTRVMRAGRHQEVTGLVVNERVGVPREVLRRFRATLHQVEHKGPQGLHWQGNADVMASLRGFADFVSMVDPTKGDALRRRVEEVAATRGLSTRKRVSHPPTPAPAQAQPQAQAQAQAQASPTDTPPPPSPSADDRPDDRPDDWYKIW